MNLHITTWHSYAPLETDCPNLMLGVVHFFVSVSLPRYARVNSLKTSCSQVEEQLVESGYECVSQEEFTSRRLLSSSPCEGACRFFCKDSLIPNLLVFCSCAPLTDTKLYASGYIVLQDKVSITSVTFRVTSLTVRDGDL